MNTKGFAQLISDWRMIIGTILLVFGAFTQLFIFLQETTRRIEAVEVTQDQELEIKQAILMQINELKTEQAVIGQQIEGVNDKVDETNSLVKQLINLLK
jgi:hypothetical protein